MKSVFPISSGDNRHHRRAAAFSLLELLVAMGMLSIIVLALFSMFDQTQKALHNAIGQVDVMESGRSAMDLLVRNIERVRSANVPAVTNLSVYRLDRDSGSSGSYSIPGILDGGHRDSALNELFYLTPVQGNQWKAEGWFVANDSNPALSPDVSLLGSLYRFESTNLVALRGPKVTNLFRQQWFEFTQQRSTNSTQFNRLLDGVVFFRTLPFGTNGVALDHTVYVPPTNAVPPGVLITNLNASVSLTAFTGKTLPSAIEVEVGMLPPKLLTQYRSLPSGNGQIRSNFFVVHAADVLIFRQRIPIRTALQ